MAHTLHYAGLTLDRADALRRDPARQAELWNSDCLLLPLIQDRNLLVVDAHPATQASLPVLRRSHLYHLLDEDHTRVFLGLQDEQAVFAIELAAEQQEELALLQPHAHFIDLRSIGSLLDNAAASLLAYARALLYWQRQTRYCSVCGTANTPVNGGHVMQCSNEHCLRQHFPRLEPAVIMLVEYRPAGSEPLVLLGRGPNWPEGVFSTLAGFVEPGESLEDAVRREVWEEAGVRVSTVSYLASQPWPFPASIMLGFMAQADNTDLQIDPHELAEARWFTAAELRTFGNWGEASAGWKMPRSDSISRFLLDHWLQQQT
ncbi:MAG: NAD(+) diphosphatase [Thiolinea sp.]